MLLIAIDIQVLNS